MAPTAIAAEAAAVNHLPPFAFIGYHVQRLAPAYVRLESLTLSTRRRVRLESLTYTEDEPMRYAIWLVALCLPLLPACSPNKVAVAVADKDKDKDKDKAPAAKTLHESWQAAYLEGLKIGHGHTLSVLTKNKDGKEVIRTTRYLDFVLKRYKSALPVRQEQVCEETPEGKVLYLEETLTIGKEKTGPLKGTVSGNQLVLVVGNDTNARKIDFPADAVGLYFQETYFSRKKPKTGDKAKITSFELSLLAPVTLTAVVKDAETTDVLILKQEGDVKKVVREPAKLTRVEAKSEKIKVNDVEVQLPPKVTWLDAKMMPVRESFEMQGAGMITMYATTKEAAMKEGVAPDLLPDLGLNVNIPVKQTIEKPYDTTEAVYKVTLAEPLDKVFVSDDRQTVREEKAKSFELVVKAVREPGKEEVDKQPAKQFLAANSFIESDDKAVVALAKKAVGDEKDAWKKAQAIEKWVHENMKVNTSTGFPTAAKIAKDLEGDCRQHALLTAAMCRAAGVPSRTAIGLLYVREQGRSPVFGFHMWTEVWVRGKWLGLDAVLGKGGIGATHLKMADHSWAETVTLAPLLPVSRTLGKLKIEVVSSK
jgi:hypothetical protein